VFRYPASVQPLRVAARLILTRFLTPADAGGPAVDVLETPMSLDVPRSSLGVLPMTMGLRTTRPICCNTSMSRISRAHFSLSDPVHYHSRLSCSRSTWLNTRCKQRIMSKSLVSNRFSSAVHTWSHPALTTLSNEQIIAELGWTKKIIKDVLGVTPNMMRPPYGDIDDRVRAISLAMGLTPVMWTRISPLATFDTDGKSVRQVS